MKLMKQRGFAPILIILLVVLMLGGYLIYSGKFNLKNSQSVNTQTSQGSSLNNTDKTSTWKDFTSPKYNPFYTDKQLKDEIDRQRSMGTESTSLSTLEKIQFSLKLPNNWVQDYNSKGLNGENDTYGSGYTFKKGTNEIRIARFYAPGGNRCELANYGNDYKDIKTDFTTLRRIKEFVNFSYIPDGFVRYVLCAEATPEGFSSNTPVGVVNFTLPKDYKPEDLETMDMIISTLRVIK